MEKILRNLIRISQQLAQLPEQPTRIQDIRALTGLTSHDIGTCLSLGGWHQEQVWTRRVDWSRTLEFWWCPPGTAAPRNPRGRPRIYATWSQLLALLPP